MIATYIPGMSKIIKIVLSSEVMDISMHVHMLCGQW